MADANEEKGPQLMVEFAGLCLYVANRHAHEVTILMPDARKTVSPQHADGEDGVFHVGYIRFNLANLDVDGLRVLDPGIIDNGSGHPPNEIVHRFDRHQVTFKIDDHDDLGVDPLAIKIGVPHFNDFADTLEAVPNLTKPNAPDALLMRTTIRGGRIEAKGLGKTWEFSSVLRNGNHEGNGNGNGKPYSGQFAGFSLWTRPIKSGRLKVIISDFNEKVVQEIPLKACDIGGKQVIPIKVANLCAHNPLEWREFPIRTVVDHDLDFKWLYRLLEPKKGDYETALAGAELPFPRAMPNQAFGDEDCMGGYIETPLR
jgi:hypothetical protein